MKRILVLLGVLLTLCSCSDIEDKIIVQEGKNEINMSIFGIDTLNPITTQSQSVTEVMNLVYDPLFRFTKDLSYIPCLAEKCTTSPDFMKTVITLDTSKKWHDGTYLNADDVIYTIDHIKQNDSIYKHNVEVILSCQKDATGCVELTLREPVMNIQGLLSFPIIKKDSAAKIAKNPVGTGVFSIEEIGASNILLKSTDAKSSIQKINVSVMRNAQACVNAFETNEIDVLTSSAIDLGELSPGGERVIQNYTTNKMTFLGFNCGSEKYKEPYLRRAILNMIDTKDIVEKAVYQRASIGTIPINPDSNIYRSPDLLELDIERTMEKAGYFLKDGKYTDENGQKLTITILCHEGNSAKVETAKRTSTLLQNAGINANVDFKNYEEYKKCVNSGNFDVFLGEVELKDNLDPSFLTKEGNYFGYINSELDGCLEKMKKSTDINSLSSAVGEYARCFAENPPFVVLYFANDAVVYSKRLSGTMEPNYYFNIDGVDKWYVKAGKSD